MEQHVVKGLVLVRRQAEGSKILVVRTGPNAPWMLPIARAGESCEDLLAALRSELFSGVDCSQASDISRNAVTREGLVSFDFVGTDAELLPYFESERYFDARWASFEEARHILRGDLQDVLLWSRRQLHKLPLQAAA